MTRNAGDHHLMSSKMLDRQRPWIVLGLVLTVVSWVVAGWWVVRSHRVSSGSVSVEIRELTVNGAVRRYRLAVPRGAATERGWPLVVALPGALDTPDEMAGYTGLDATAAKHGFAVAYLEGRHLNWPPFIPPENPGIMQPDVDFFAALCETLVADDGIDPARIYVVGVSQGGAMANVLTAMSAGRIAATVCNCGWLPAPLGETPLKTARPVPMLFIVGSNDRQVSPTTVRAAHDAFQRAGHPVTWYEIEGHGHGWANVDELNERIWAFCAAHENSPSPRGVVR